MSNDDDILNFIKSNGNETDTEDYDDEVQDLYAEIKSRKFSRRVDDEVLNKYSVYYKGVHQDVELMANGLTMHKSSE